MTDIAALGLRIDGINELGQASVAMEKLADASLSAEKALDKVEQKSKRAKKEKKELADETSKVAEEEKKVAEESDKSAKAIDKTAESSKKAKKAKDDLADASRKVAKEESSLVDASAKVDASNIKQDASIKALIASNKMLSDSVKSLSTTVSASAQAYQSQTQSVTVAANAMQSVAAENKAVAAAAQSSVGSINAAAAAMDKLSAGVSTSPKSDGMPRQLKSVGDEAKKAEKPVVQLTEAERKFAEQAERAGMSVNGMKAALRGLPAQFTDIAVSLQGGQSPLTVFLQQGGQLKDMFGGAGVAARAMAGYITGLINPFSLAATAVTALGVAYYQGSKEADAFRVSLATTGNAIGTTTDALTIYSRQIAQAGETQGKAAESLNVFVAAGFKSEEQLAQFTRTAIAWERATGEGVDSVAEKFVALEKDPLKAAMKLQESMNFLTVDIYKQIKALEDQGNKLGAAALAMGAYDAAMAKSTKTILENMGYLEYSAYVVTTGFKGMWDMVAGIGRPSPENDKLIKAYNELNDLVLAGAESHPIQAGRVEALRSEISALESNAKATRDKTEADKQSAIAVKELSAFDAKYSDALKDKLTLEQTLANARKEALSVGKSEADITKILAYETEKYNKANKTRAVSTKAIENSYRTLAERAAEYVKSLQLEAKQGEKISKSQQLEIELQSLLVRGKGKGTDASVAQTKALIAEAKAMETQAKARKAMAEAAEQYQKDLEEIAEYQQKESEAVAKQAQATYEAGKALENESRMLELQTGLIGASTQARELAIEQLRIQIELEKELDALDNNKALSSDARETAKNAARERAVQRGANAEKKILIDSYNEIGKYVEDALYDAIVTGGASAGEALERMFKNLVLQPIVKAGVQSLLGSVGLGGGEGGSASGISLPGTSFNIAGSLSGMSYDASLKALEYGFNDTAKSLVSFGNTIQNADAWLKNIPGMSGGLNSVLGYGSSLLSLSQGNYGSAVGGALGTLVGAGNPIGTWIGSTLGSLVDGMFGGVTPHAGAASVYSGGMASGNAKTAKDLVNAHSGDYIQAMQAPMDALASTVGSTFDALATRFNKAAGYLVEVGFTSDNNDPSSGRFRLANAAGENLDMWGISRRDPKYTSRGTKGYASDTAEGYDEYLKDVAIASLQGIADIVPAWAANMARSVESGLGEMSGAESFQAFQAVVTEIAKIDAAFIALAETLPMFAGITDDVKSSLLGALGGFEGFSSAANTFYNAFYSEAERMERVSRQLEEATGIDPRTGEKAKEQFRAAVETALQGGQGELAAKLLSLSGSFSNLAEYAEKAAEANREAAEAAQELLLAEKERSRYAVEELARSRTAALSSMADTAWKNLEASIDRQRDKWTKVSNAASEAVSEIGGILSTLTSNATDLYGTISAASQMQAVQGSLYIESALAAVRNGKSVRSFGGLSSAIDAARGGLDAGNFSTAFEQQRETQRLANQLGELGEYADDQLTVEEKALETARQQLEQLNKTSEYWAAQLDIGASQISATMTVAQAVANLGPILSSLKAANNASTNQSYYDQKLAQLRSTTPTYGGVDWNKADTNDLRAFIGEHGMTAMQHWELFGRDEGLSMPSFDVGTNYVPNDMIAQIHEGEAIIPKQYNPYAGGSINAGVETMLSQFISDNRNQASSIIRLQSTMSRIIERWNLEGLPQPRDEARV